MKIQNSEELRDIVLMALRTGMRLGEIGALRNMDVDLAAGFIIVQGSYCAKEGVRKNTTKSKKARRIEINSDAREILERRKFKPQKEPLFNIHMNSIKFFPRTCRWAGVKEIHFHSLRHTASRQWSRKDRKSKTEEPTQIQPVETKKGLRLVVS